MPRRPEVNTPEKMTLARIAGICNAYESYLKSLERWPLWKKLNHHRQHKVCFDSLKSLLKRLEELERLDEAAQNNEQQATYVDLWYFLASLYGHMGNNKSLLPRMILNYFNEAFFDQEKSEGRIEKYDGTTGIDPPDVSREMLKKLLASGSCPRCRKLVTEQQLKVLTEDELKDWTKEQLQDLTEDQLQDLSENTSTECSISFASIGRGKAVRTPCCRAPYDRDEIVQWFRASPHSGMFKELLPNQGDAPRPGVPLPNQGAAQRPGVPLAAAAAYAPEGRNQLAG